MIKSSQRGFTLIELVVVIVILGILAAFAVPRFMGLEREARVSAVKSMAGAMRSAAAMAHSVCLAQNCGNTGTITVDGNTITMVNGYPNVASMPNLLQSVDGFTLSTPVANRWRLTKTGSANANCYVEYEQAAANNSPRIRYQAGYAGTAAETAIDSALRTAC